MRRQLGRARAFLAPRRRSLGVVLLALALLAVLIFLLWKLPEWHVAAVAYTGPTAAHDRMYDENAMRATLAQIIGGSILLVGLYFTARNVHAAEEGHLTDRFAKAIEQLGSDKREIRLGGIYALERVARDSARDYWPVIEVLTAYVREHAPLPPKAQQQAATPSERRTATRQPRRSDAPTHTVGPRAAHPRSDIQAILTVIGRRQRRFGNGEEQRLDLHGTNLPGAELPNAQLEGADLTGANLTDAVLTEAVLTGAGLTGAGLRDADLTGAKLWEADLRGANLGGAILLEAELTEAHLREADLTRANLREAFLMEADLTGAKLMEADLTGAKLMKADLAGAKLMKADLTGANLTDAVLTGADLRGANLTDAVLTIKQLRTAIIDETTILPSDLRPAEPSPDAKTTEETQGDEQAEAT